MTPFLREQARQALRAVAEHQKLDYPPAALDAMADAVLAVVLREVQRLAMADIETADEADRVAPLYQFVQDRLQPLLRESDPHAGEPQPSHDELKQAIAWALGEDQSMGAGVRARGTFAWWRDQIMSIAAPAVERERTPQDVRQRIVDAANAHEPNPRLWADDGSSLGDKHLAAAREVLAILGELIQKRYTAALNNGTAIEHAIIVGEALRELQAALVDQEPSHD